MSRITGLVIIMTILSASQYADAASNLVEAAAAGDVNAIKEMLAAGALPGIKDGSDRTPLLMALQNRHREAAELLADKGYVPGIVDDSDYAPIHIAARLGYAKVVKSLLAQGAPLQSDKGWQPLHEAARSGDLETVKVVMNALVAEHKATPGFKPQVWDSRGLTPQHYAAAAENSGKVITYLKEYGFPVEVLDKRKRQYPLDIAVYHGQIGNAKALLDAGATKMKSRDATYLYALLGLKDKVAGSLASGKVQLASGRIHPGVTLLQAAVIGGHTDLVKFLLVNGADVNVATWEDINSITAEGIWGKQTAAWLACKHGHLDVLKLLVEKGAELNFVDVNGNAPIHAAVMGRHKDIIEYLITQGTHLGITGPSGRSALAIARINKYNEIAELIGFRKSIYDEIRIGMSQSDVEAVLGPPTSGQVSKENNTRSLSWRLSGKEIIATFRDVEKLVFNEERFDHEQVKIARLVGKRINQPDSDKNNDEFKR